jgi:hypothetical protein
MNTTSPPGAPTESTPGQTNRVQEALNQARRQQEALNAQARQAAREHKRHRKTLNRARPPKPLEPPAVINLPIEQWRPIAGYEGAYMVSDHGRVRSLDRVITYRDGRTRFHPGRILRPGDTGGGHIVYLGAGIQNQKSVHRLVLEAFVGPCPPGMEACHWNDIRHDNRLENLRWDTHSANEFDKVRNGRHRRAGGKTHRKNSHELAPITTQGHSSGHISDSDTTHAPTPERRNRNRSAEQQQQQLDAEAVAS